MFLLPVPLGTSTQNQYWLGLEKSSPTSYVWSESQSPIANTYIAGQWDLMEPHYNVGEPVGRLLSQGASGTFKLADVADTPPGYPLCEIGEYSATVTVIVS